MSYGPIFDTETDEFTGKLNGAFIAYAEEGTQDAEATVIELYEDASARTLTPDNKEALIIGANFVKPNLDFINNLFDLTKKCDGNYQTPFAKAYKDALVRGLKDNAFPKTDKKLTTLSNKHLYATSEKYNEIETVLLQESTIEIIKEANKTLLQAMQEPRKTAEELNNATAITLEKFKANIQKNVTSLILRAGSHIIG